MKSLATLAVLALAALPAFGQCENGSCAAPPTFLPAAPVFLPPTITRQIQAPIGENKFHYEWRKVNADANVIALVRVSTSRGTELVAYLDVEAGTWRWTYDGERVDLFKAAGKTRPEDTGAKAGKVAQAKPLENKGKVTPLEDIAKPAGKVAHPPTLVGDAPPATEEAERAARRERYVRDLTARGIEPEEIDRVLRTRGLLPTAGEKPAAKPMPATKGGIAESDDASDACGCDDCACDPCKCATRPVGHVADGTVPPDGVDLSKLKSDGGGSYQISGKEVGKETAIQEIAKGTSAAGVPDDGRHLRISVITADPARRKQIAAEIEQSPGFAPLKATAIVEGYAPEGWALKDLGFKMPDSPNGVVIYAQAPTGKVLYRQDTWGGADGYVRALREKVPGYNSANDPQPAFGAGGIWTPWMLTVPAGVLGILYMTRKQKATVPA